MSILEVIAGGVEVDLNLVDATLFHPDFFGEAFPVARAYDSILDVVRGAIGVDIDEFRGEVSVLRG